jgi:hypothetical protein
VSVTRQEAAAYRAVGGAGLVALHEALKVRLAGIGKATPLLDTKSGRQRVPNVYEFNLPPKDPKTTEAEQFPFFLVRPNKGTDSEQGAAQDAKAEIAIIVGTYSDTDDGGVDLLNLIQAVREDLAAQPVLTGTAFEHTGPLTWETENPPPRPQWIGQLITTWTIPRPRRIEARNPTEEP